MKEIQGKSRREGRNTSFPKNACVGDGGKSVLVRVRARFELGGGELSGVNCKSDFKAKSMAELQEQGLQCFSGNSRLQLKWF